MTNTDRIKNDIIVDIQEQTKVQLSHELCKTLKKLSLNKLRQVKEGFTASYDSGRTKRPF
jgi:hypothetical protein